MIPWLGLACLRKACLLVGAGADCAGVAFEVLLAAGVGVLSAFVGGACGCDGGAREAAGPFGVVCD